METKDIDKQVNALYSAPVIYQWEFSGYPAKNADFFRWLIALFCSGVLPLFLFLVTDTKIFDQGFFLLLSLFIIGSLMVRYLFIPDIHNCYSLTNLGIYYTSEDMIPESAYRVMRGIAWVGVIVCFMAVYILGPLAFVGAGAFALLSFKMTNFTSVKRKCRIVFYKESILFDVIDDVIIDIRPYFLKSYLYSGDVFCSDYSEKEKIIESLCLILPDAKVVRINKRNDKYKHDCYIKKTDHDLYQ